MLSPYRVLDLTDHRGEIAGMVLADLGADVIKVEPPAGSPGRRQGPMLTSGPVAERSLQFTAYNRNKRSIVLSLDAASDRKTFLELVGAADILLESGGPGALAEQGLTFDRLRAANSRLVYVRITPFGSDGPYADHPAADLTLAAMGGPLRLQGTPERAPVRVSVPQVWRHTGVEAAVAALVGLERMRRSQEAQFVDVSAQCVMTWTMLNAMEASAIQGWDFERAGATMQLGNLSLPLRYPAADGYIVAIPNGALMAKLVPWMIREGVVPPIWQDDEDWPTYDRRLLQGQPLTYDREVVLEALARFFARHTKAELLAWGLDEGVTIAPVNTVADVLAFRQLAERDYWTTIELPDGRTVSGTGPFARPSATALRSGGRAPALDADGERIRQELRERVPRPPQAPSPAPDGGAGALPFEGLKIADFSWIGVGPITAKYFADHGATVVRVESETRPDNLRAAGPFSDGVPGANRSQFFGDFNTSKLGLALDLKSPAGLDVAKRLIAWADVCFESFTPGTMKALGIDYPVVRAINPSIIMVSTCLMGQTGPAAGFAGYGYHAAAIAGFFEVTGWPDLPPDGPWNAYTDMVSPRFLAATVMAAVDHRRRTGEGQQIDAAQLEMGLHFLAPEILALQATGRAAGRTGNRATDAAPQGLYPCAGDDEWCAIAVETDAQWRSLRALLGDPSWALAPALDSHTGRLVQHDQIDEAIAGWTAPQPADVVMRTLLAAGIPAGVAQRSRDLLTDPQYAHRGFYRYLEHPEMGRIPVCRARLPRPRLRQRPAPARAAAWRAQPARLAGGPGNVR